MLKYRIWRLRTESLAVPILTAGQSFFFSAEELNEFLNDPRFEGGTFHVETIAL